MTDNNNPFINTPNIGIVGGIGAYAGLDLMRKILDQTIANNDQEHLPVHLLSLPAQITDRTAFLLGESSKNPAFALAGVVRTLHASGASIVGIACNTAHADKIFNVMLANIDIQPLRVLHMIEETMQYICNNHPQARRIGVLSTTGTWKSKIYSDALANHDLEEVRIDISLQELVHAAIYDAEYGIKACSNPISDRARKQLEQVIRHMQQAGAQAIILGCSELPLVFTADKYTVQYASTPLIDPSFILARALIAVFDPKKLRPLA
ncbi:MAG: amino acid racemase [Mariprofundales bacterium]